MQLDRLLYLSAQSKRRLAGARFLVDMQIRRDGNGTAEANQDSRTAGGLVTSVPKLASR